MSDLVHAEPFDRFFDPSNREPQRTSAYSITVHYRSPSASSTAAGSAVRVLHRFEPVHQNPDLRPSARSAATEGNGRRTAREYRKRYIEL